MSGKIAEIRARHNKIAATWSIGTEDDAHQTHVDRGVLLAEAERLRAEVERLHRAHQAACEGGDLLRAEVERLREENGQAHAVIFDAAKLTEKLRAAEAMEARLEQDNDMLRRQARTATRSREALSRMRERLLAEVERLRAENKRLAQYLTWIRDQFGDVVEPWCAEKARVALLGGGR